MKLAQIENGIVVNLIEVDAAAIPDWAKGWPEAGPAEIGWLQGKDGLVAPDTSAADQDRARKTASLSKGEFCGALMQLDVLQPDEAVAACKGDWPASLLPFLDMLDAKNRAAKMDDKAIAKARAEVILTWAGVITINRSHELVLMLAYWLGLDDAQVDKIFGIAG